MALIPIELVPWAVLAIILVVIDQAILQGRFTSRLLGSFQRVSAWSPNPGCYYNGQYIVKIEELGYVTEFDGVLGKRKVQRYNMITANGERIGVNEPIWVELHGIRQWNTQPYMLMDLPSTTKAVFEENGRLKQDLDNALADRETSYLAVLDSASKIAVSMGGIKKELGVGAMPWVAKKTAAGATIHVPVGGEAAEGE